jgi:hypothetical protein
LSLQEVEDSGLSTFVVIATEEFEGVVPVVSPCGRFVDYDIKAAIFCRDKVNEVVGSITGLELIVGFV